MHNNKDNDNNSSNNNSNNSDDIIWLTYVGGGGGQKPKGPLNVPTRSVAKPVEARDYRMAATSYYSY